MDQLEARLVVWNDLRSEVRQHMQQLDRLLIVIAVIMMALIGASWLDRAVDPRFGYAIVAAAVFGAFAPWLVARQDILIHRPVPAIEDIEDSFGQDHSPDGQGQLEPFFHGWENWYKPNLKTGVKILVPLDVLAAVPILLLFWYANDEAAKFLAIRWFYSAMGIVFLGGVGLIASAKVLAE